MAEWSVLVTNVGTVLRTETEQHARKEFNDYVRMSKAPYGRTSGESVTLLSNDQIQREYIGKLYRKDD